MPEVPVLIHAGRSLCKQDPVSPDETDITSDLTFDFPRFPITAHGEKVLLLVPTENKFKTKVLKERVMKEVGEANLVIHQHNVDTGVDQPYDEMGVECLVFRTKGMIRFLEENPDFLETNAIGNVFIGVIENYIRLPESGTQNPGSQAHDFGIVMLYNATTLKVAYKVSEGVPVQEKYLKEARQEGIVNGREKGGKVTYGSILKKHFAEPTRELSGAEYDISKDWHLVVCGKSRYELLENTVASLSGFM
jgi:hypothetical protein